MKKTIGAILVIAIAVISAATSANAQVVTQLTKENLKIPKTQKPVAKQQANKNVATKVEIDTTTLYFKMADSAQVCIKDKNWAKAEGFIRQALASDPHNPNNSLLISNLATLQRYEGKLTDAVKNYTLALDLTPNSVTLLLNRAALYTQMDSLNLALADYERVKSLDATEQESRYYHGMIELQLNNPTIANNDFEELLRINPESANAKEGLGALQKAAGNYEKAAQYYSDVIKAKPSAEMLANRADCYLMIKRLNDAEDDIRNALQLTPDDGYLYLLRAKLNKLRFNNEDKERDLKLAEQHGVDPKLIKSLKY
jgi:tetratricopeptide (TPR) repeat protein